MKAVLAAILILFTVVPAADAAGWSRTRTFAAGLASGIDEPAPRAAIDARGRSLLVWDRADGRLMASAGDARGSFGKPVEIARRPRDFAVAPGAIAYEAADGIHVAVRDGRRFRDRRVATSTGSEINGIAIAADPLGGWVVAERQFPRRGSGVPYRVRALSLDERGRPVGEIQDLGLGEFGLDARPTQALVVTADGRALLAFRREAPRGNLDPQPVVLAMRPHGGAFGAPVAVGTGLTDPRLTIAGGEGVLAVTQITTCGDASCAGQPRASRIAADGTPGPLAGPVLPKPNRASGPWATGNALLFQLKDRVEPFSREIPVRAVTLRADGSVGPLQTLTSRRATEPVGLPLSGGRTLAVWATRSALDAALAGQNGRFKPTTAPVGPPPAPYHTNATNRDARSAGRYAIVAWARGGIVRVSVRRF